MRTNEIDEELATFIEATMDNEKSHCAALDKVIAWQKEHRGLKGFHISAPLDVMCGQRQVEDPYAESEKMAHDVLKMMLASARGQLEEVDVTKEVL